ncbi:MAG TPA: hypothetical protein VK435_02130 [Thermodesulfovibrionales bacterium]|nr:hypothetical protein [Thermodesulfovibrionales bacterium]
MTLLADIVGTGDNFYLFALGSSLQNTSEVGNKFRRISFSLKKMETDEMMTSEPDQ